MSSRLGLWLIIHCQGNQGRWSAEEISGKNIIIATGSNQQFAFIKIG